MIKTINLNKAMIEIAKWVLISLQFEAKNQEMGQIGQSYLTKTAENYHKIKSP